MQIIKEQIDETLEAYPSLTAKEEDGIYIVSGLFVMNAEYNGIPLYDEYEIEVDVSDHFPGEVPNVKCLGGDIPGSFEHFYDNGALCLGATCELYDFLAMKPSLKSFIDEIVMSYFYTVSYYKRYGIVPFGERSHDIKGIEEAYMERYGVTDQDVLIELLLYMVGIQRYRGHTLCPCGSGKKIRNCHGSKLLKDILSPLKPVYQRDAYAILSYCIETRRKNDGRKCATENRF